MGRKRKLPAVKFDNFQPDSNLSAEENAILLGENASKLKQHLIDYVPYLLDQYSEKFKINHFDFKNKRLYSECREYYLQWSLREYPEEPISLLINKQYYNGTIKLVI